MGYSTDGLLGKKNVKIIPREDYPVKELELQTTPKITSGRFLHNGQGNGTIEPGPRIYNKIKSD